MTNRSSSHACCTFRGIALVLCVLGLAGCDSEAAGPEGESAGAGPGSGGASSASGGEGGSGAGAGVGGSGGAGPTSLTLETLDASSGAALAGVPVVVSNADGSLSASAASGDDGTVELIIPDGGFVSVLWSFDELTTFYLPALRRVHEVRSFHPPPGLHELEVRLQPSDSVPDEPMSVSFEIPAMPGVTNYWLQLSCGVSGGVAAQEGTAKLTGYWGCPGQDTFDAMLVAYNGEDSSPGFVRPVAYAVQNGISFVEGSDVLLELDFAATGAPLAEVPFEAHGGFGDELRVSMTSMPQTSSGPQFGDGYVQEPAKADFTTTLRAAPGFASSYCYTIGWTDYAQQNDSGEARRGCSEELPASVTFEGGRLAMPTIRATASSVSFSVPAEGELGDGLELQAQRGTFDGDTRWRWWAVRDLLETGSFVFPELPDGQAAFGFGGQGVEPVPVAVSVSNVDLLDVTDGFVDAMASVPFGNISSKHQLEIAFGATTLD